MQMKDPRNQKKENPAACYDEKKRKTRRSKKTKVSNGKEKKAEIGGRRNIKPVQNTQFLRCRCRELTAADGGNERGRLPPIGESRRV